MSIDTLDSVYTVWRGHSLRTDTDPARDSILFKRNTISFDRSIEIDPFSRNFEGAGEPAVAAMHYNVYVVWHGIFQPSQARQILYTRSTDGGANFGIARTLSNNAASFAAPAVAASGNNVHVVWVDEDSDILYTRSTDGGANFGSTVNLSNNIEISLNPAVAVSNNLT
jgi:hypothetical protein